MKKKLLDIGKLEEKLTTSNLVRLSEIQNHPLGGTVCVIYPYQSAVTSNISHSSQINNHLQSINYSVNESEWAIIILDNNTLYTNKIPRSKNLDILAPSTGKINHQNKWPENFTPKNCAPLHDAAFAKTILNDRILITLGEFK